MVGTWFGRRFWGTGANRESKALVAHLAFEVLGMHRLGSYSNPANVRSTKALLGVGFTQEGVLRHWHRHGDDYYDVNVFGMLRSDWEAGPLASVPVAVEGQRPRRSWRRRRGGRPRGARGSAARVRRASHQLRSMRPSEEDRERHAHRLLPSPR